MPASLIPRQSKIDNLNSRVPNLLLVLFIITYTLYFSWYTINRHNTLNSYAADLSLIDQPMWNTVRGPGGFMELTWGDGQQPRLAEHFEPILIPLALLFFLWDDVRILLIAQSLALALGALPVFWIARHQLAISPPATLPTPLTPSWAALTFSAAYLLFPHLQAANIADFHADSFVVTPLLFAVWYASRRRWPWMWFWAAIAMLSKETLPTLTAMLGLLLIVDFYRTNRSNPANNRSKLKHGLALSLVSTTWFLIATFLIVAPLARQYFGTDGPIYLANRFEGGLTALPQLLQDPDRWRYLFGLFAAVGFLPLLAPELLILGLPVLVANVLSNFPGQYSGEQHYSAPLVAAFMLAAIYGTRRLLNRISLREDTEEILKQTVLIAVCLWLLGWSLGYHSLRGWTPLSVRTETYQMKPAARQLADFTTLIPSEAVISASPGVHPHLAHRRVAYVFPTVQEADYLLVDVTDISGVHPFDAHAQIMDLLNQDWRVLKANHGLLLATKASLLLRSHKQNDAPLLPCPSAPISKATLPCPFFNFVQPTTPPTYATGRTFGDGRLRLLGFDVFDDPDDGVTIGFHWQPADTLPETLKLWPLIYNDLGQLLSDPTQVPLPATVWYPPATWLPGEIVTTATLPLHLPDSFHLGLAAGPTTASFRDPGQRWPIINIATNHSIRLRSGRWTQLASFKRQGPFLTGLAPVLSRQALSPIKAQFGPSIQLTGFWFDSHDLGPGTSLPILLEWTAKETPEANYTVFVHLVTSDGKLVAQSDAFPTWLTPQPTSHWSPNQPTLDSHSLNLPSNLSPATYTIQVGLYNAQSQERLSLLDGTNALQLGEIRTY